jgi:hypothetical protein
MGQQPRGTRHVLDHYGLAEAAADSVREQTAMMSVAAILSRAVQ